VKIAERVVDKDPSRYLLSLQQMIENEYPIPSYLADLFQKPEGWIETPKPPQETILFDTTKKAEPKVYAIDCEMVRFRTLEKVLN
jgi:RNA exonuclease 1